MTRPIAFYLPQFHPFPENDEWWGKGFTEWTNVTKAKPRFKGHYQPHLPTDLGFYDLRLEETMIQQVTLAKEYGIHGFCYYHYWFNGKLLMERPLEQMLDNPDIIMPFCLCWANENWTRRWDGSESEILIKQNYDLSDDREHIKYLIRFFKDDRYICIHGKPVMLVYRTELLLDIQETVKIWKEECLKAGLKGLYLIRVENFVKDVDPTPIGFDASVDFAPDFSLPTVKYLKKRKPILYTWNKLIHKVGLCKNGHYKNKVYDYDMLVSQSIKKKEPNFKRFSCVCPSWDNSARRKGHSLMYYGSTPKRFAEWTKHVVNRTTQTFDGDEKIFFINAWNEWAEGCHLEPDRKYGYQYLEAIRDSL